MPCICYSSQKASHISYSKAVQCIPIVMKKVPLSQISLVLTPVTLTQQFSVNFCWRQILLLHTHTHAHTHANWFVSMNFILLNFTQLSMSCVFAPFYVWAGPTKYTSKRYKTNCISFKYKTTCCFILYGTFIIFFTI